MSRELSHLVPEFREKFGQLLAACLNRGVTMVPYATLRDPWTQARYWRQSRSRPEIMAKIQELRNSGASFLAEVIESSDHRMANPSRTPFPGSVGTNGARRSIASGKSMVEPNGRRRARSTTSMDIKSMPPKPWPSAWSRAVTGLRSKTGRMSSFAAGNPRSRSTPLPRSMRRYGHALEVPHRHSPPPARFSLPTTCGLPTNPVMAGEPSPHGRNHPFSGGRA